MTKKAKEYLQSWTSYRHKRYWTFLIISLVSLGLPFIIIDGSHFFLLDFETKQLHLFFTTFDMQEMYMMPFLLILGFIGIFFMTTLGGRVWCGWACPQTIFRVIYRDFIQTTLLGLRRNINNKQKEAKKDIIKTPLAVLIWAALSFVAAANFMWYFIPPETFFEYLKAPMEHTTMFGVVLSIALFLIYDIISLKEDFCIYICPYSRVQSVMYDEETIQTIYNTERGGDIYNTHGGEKNVKNLKELTAADSSAECTYCDACVRVCPTHIDIKKGLQLECINCLECSDACTEVMGALGKESLITWTSDNAIAEKRAPKYIRPRTIGYVVALIISLFMLFYMGSTKENMLLNINRTTSLYSIKDHGNAVTNNYTMLFQNTDTKTHEYYFSIEGNTGVEIKRPKDKFKLLAGKKAKKIVIFVTHKELIKDDRKDTPIPLTIKAYAVDDPENIVVFRKTTFIYPKYTVLQKARNK